MYSFIPVTEGDGSAKLAVDSIGGSGFQRVKLVLGPEGQAIELPGDAANGMDVDVTRVSGNVTVVQGTATNLKVDASGATVPVSDASGSLTVDAPVGTPVFVRLSDGAVAIATLPVQGTVTGNQGAAQSLANAWPTKITDGVDAVEVTDVGGDICLNVAVKASVDSAVVADKAGFTEGTGKVEVAGGVVNDTISADPTEDQAAALRLTTKRGLHVNLRDAGGTELGDADAAPLVVALNGNLHRTIKRNALTYVASTAGQVCLTPGAGKKLILQSVIIVPTAAGLVQIYDSSNSGAKMIFQGSLPSGLPPVVITFPHGHPLDAADEVLKCDTGSGAAGSITTLAYEV